MRIFVITSLTTLIMSYALAQESENAPLELGRPSATPIKIKRTPIPPPTLEPPPKVENPEPVKVKKVVKVKKTKPMDPPVTVMSPPSVNPSPTKTLTPEPVVAPQPALVKTAPAPIVKAPPEGPKPVAVNPEVSQKTGGSLRHPAYLNFRFANIWAVRNKTNTGSFILSWDPVIFPWKRFNFGATLGVTQFESESVSGYSAKSFLVYEYGLSTSYYMSRTFLPELVIGAQMWNDPVQSTNSLLVAFNGNFLFRKKPFGYLERAYVGFGSLQVSGGSTNIFRFGVGVRF